MTVMLNRVISTCFVAYLLQFSLAAIADSPQFKGYYPRPNIKYEIKSSVPDPSQADKVRAYARSFAIDYIDAYEALYLNQNSIPAAFSPFYQSREGAIQKIESVTDVQQFYDGNYPEVLRRYLDGVVNRYEGSLSQVILRNLQRRVEKLSDQRTANQSEESGAVDTLRKSLFKAESDLKELKDELKTTQLIAVFGALAGSIGMLFSLGLYLKASR